MKKISFAALVLTIGILGTSNANATLTFSDIGLTTNALSFTINGDLTGYTMPSDAKQFGIQYTGNLLLSGTYTPNSWSTSVFDNKSINMTGNTGVWDSAMPYTWSWYDSNLVNATATNRHISLTGPTFDTTKSGQINFTWGWANTLGNPTILATANITPSISPVPEPETYGMMLMGIGLMGFVARRRNGKQA